MTKATTPNPSLDDQPEEPDHVEIYDDEADSLDEPDFDAPEQNAKESTS